MSLNTVADWEAQIRHWNRDLTLQIAHPTLTALLTDLNFAASGISDLDAWNGIPEIREEFRHFEGWQAWRAR
jgi:hypothetical protein